MRDLDPVEGCLFVGLPIAIIMWLLLGVGAHFFLGWF